MWCRAHRLCLGEISGRVLSGRAGLHRLRRARRVRHPVGAGRAIRGARGVLGDGGVHRDPDARLAVRVSRRSAGVEVKKPLAQVPPPGWSDMKDLQEWEKYHQVRTDGDKTSNTLASIAD